MTTKTTSKKKFLQFENAGTSPSGLTRILHVWNLDGDVFLGSIHWAAGWRRYCFFPAEQTQFDAACLQEITDKLMQLMHERN